VNLNIIYAPLEWSGEGGGISMVSSIDPTIFCHAKHRAAGVSAPTIKKSHFVIVRGLFAALGHWNENPYRNHTMCR